MFLLSGMNCCMHLKSKFVVFLLAFMISAVPSSFATLKDSSALFKARFLNHEEQTFVVDLTDYSVRNDDTTRLERLSFNADVFVSDSSKTGYLTRWRFHTFSINTDSRLLQRLIAHAKPVDVTCSVSPVGELQEFIRWESISTCLDEGFKQMLPAYAVRSDSAAMLEIQRSYALRSSLEGAFLRIVRLFHQLHGYGYELGKTVDVPTQLIYPGSSEKVPGVVRKQLTRLDSDNATAVVSTVSIPRQAWPYKMGGSTVFDLKTGWVLYTFEQLERGPETDRIGQRLELRHIAVTFNQ